MRIGFFVHCRHQLISEDDLGPLYDLLIDDPPEIRHAIGALVFEHLIAQKFTTSQSGSRGLKSIHELFNSNGYGYFVYDRHLMRTISF